MENIAPSPTPKGLDTPSDRKAAFEQNLVNAFQIVVFGYSSFVETMSFGDVDCMLLKATFWNQHSDRSL